MNSEKKHKAPSNSPEGGELGLVQKRDSRAKKHSAKASLSGRFGGACFLLIILLSISSCGVNRRINRADRHFAVGEYHEAGNLYRTAFNRVSAQDRPLRARLAFYEGVSRQKTNHFRTVAAFESAIRNNFSDSIVFLHFAQALQREGRYADAARNFEIFLQYEPENIVAQNGLYATKMVAEWRQNPTRHQVRLAPEFNNNRSRFSTFSPTFVGQSADMLIFSSTRQIGRQPRVRINPITGMPNAQSFSMRTNAVGEWEAPELLPEEINAPNSENGVVAFTSDGRTMFFTRAARADTDAGAQIMMSQRAGGAWSEPTPLRIFQDSTITVAHPAISPDGTMIYFVSDAPGGFGGNDIWRGRLAGNEVQHVENLGPDINTSGDEMFPMMRHDGVLFFSSDGHPGFGGLDIFRATPFPDEERRWTVENMGFPMNSRWDDFGITFKGTTESGFFSSNRRIRSDSHNPFDMVWSFCLPELAYFIEGRVLDDRGEIVPDALIRMVGTDGTNARIQARRDGSFRLRLDNNVDYVMMASARGHLNQNHAFNTQGFYHSQTINFDFTLTPAFRPVQLDNIFFDFGRWELRPDSEEGLQALLTLLNDNPNITIELSAHTDFVGSAAANQQLSERRANSVLEYLVRHGIARERLTAVGHGFSRPFTVDANLAKRYDFLTEGDVLTETFIRALTPEQQAIANQINRRTEFRVLRTTFNLR